MMLLTALLISALAATPTPKSAGYPGTQRLVYGGAADSILLSTGSAETLRERLLQFSAHCPDRVQASRALYYRGYSFEREAQLDSAIANYRRAYRITRISTVHLALVQALLRRRQGTDVQDVIHLLESESKEGEGEGVGPVHSDPALLGWAYVLGGDARRGLEIMQPAESRLKGVEWRYRFARAYYDQGDYGHALPYLIDLAVTSRLQDREIAQMLSKAEKNLGANAHIRDRVDKEMQRHDEDEARVLEALHGRRIRIKTLDGSLVGGAVFADSLGPPLRRACILLAGLGDELSAYDSLTTALRAAGFAIVLLDPRGSGWSVQPEVPMTDTWGGREHALEALVADDVTAAWRVLTQLAHVDTSACLGIGVGTMAPIMITAAGRDPHLTALALLDPFTSMVERGETLERFRQLQVPTYLQIGPRDRWETSFADTMFRAGTQRSSHLAETASPGFGAGQFGSSGVTGRFIRWIDEAMPVHGGRRGAPRPSPRAG